MLLTVYEIDKLAGGSWLLSKSNLDSRSGF